MTGYYKKNNKKGANTYGEARRGKGQNQSRVVGASNSSTKTPLEIAREEDNLEEELGYRVPGLNGLEGADAEDVQLGWLVNASAVRFIRILFFLFVCFFVRERDRDTKGSPRENSKIFKPLPKEGRLERALSSLAFDFLPPLSDDNT